jgi:hypothetical protein
VKKIILIIILILISVLIFKTFDWNFLTKDLTVYPIECEKRITENYCAETSKPLDVMIFRISRVEEEISLWKKDSDTPVAKYKGCMIRSYYNWRCEGSDDSKTFGFDKGKYWEDPPNEYIYYVSKQEWLKLKCGDCSFPELLLFILLKT